jgi:hypothetical protein
MTARDLKDVDRYIVETREHINIQRDVVRKFNDGGHIEDATLAEGILRALEKSLDILQKRRRTALRQSAPSRSGISEKPQRRSKHA